MKIKQKYLIIIMLLIFVSIASGCHRNKMCRRMNAFRKDMHRNIAH